MKKKYLHVSRLIACLVVFVLAVTLSLSATKKKTTRKVVSATPKVADVKYWTGPESTQIAFYFQGRVDYDVSPISGNRGFIFYTNNASYSGGESTITVEDGVIQSIVTRNSGGVCKVTVTFQVPTEYKVSRDHVDRNYPVIEIMRPRSLQPSHPSPQQISELKKSNKIIMIDPGHGGWHSGAGGNGLLEKNITMQLAIELKRKIDAIPGYKAFMTRDPNYNGGDYYVSLERRREMASEYGSDLFISIHLNSPGNENRRDVHGTEIYYLAYGDASDAESQKLADLENAADLEPGQINKQNDIVEELLQDERMIALNNQSSLLAGLTLNNILEAQGLTSRGVKHARFAVLKNKVPAILIEVVFVTNPREANLLVDSTFRFEFTKKMCDAITQYFSINNGRPGTIDLNSRGPSTSSPDSEVTSAQ